MKQKTILITGATGFLGSFITQELLEAGFRLKLLVRKTHSLQATERVSEIFPLSALSVFADRTRVGRIEIIEGDVSKKYLGLDTREYRRLAETIDEVFHCAAATKFNDGHNTLTQTNVSGTETVVRFCYTEKIKRLHYISTAYVAGKRRDVVYEDELDKGQAFNNNYEKSKFDAEKILGQFVRQYDVPTTVYRPSIIVGNSRTGYTKNYDNIYIFGKGLYYLKNYKTQKSHENDFSMNPKRIHQSSYLRIPGDKYGTINLIPVDYAARAIITISRRDESINKIFHIVNPSPPTLGEVAEWMAVATGNRIRIVPFHELQAQPYTVFEKLFLRGTEAFQPYLFGESYFDFTNTKRLLSGTGIECPLITQEHINRFIQYGVNTHWGKKNTTSGKEDRFLKIQESLFSVIV